MTVKVDETEIKLVLERLDTVKIELLRLRAMLLPEENTADPEKNEILIAKKENAKGSAINLD
jgi:hypothetical protein